MPSRWVNARATGRRLHVALMPLTQGLAGSAVLCSAAAHVAGFGAGMHEPVAAIH